MAQVDYMMAEIPAKGLGLVATGALLPGHVILEKDPIIVSPREGSQGGFQKTIQVFST